MQAIQERLKLPNHNPPDLQRTAEKYAEAAVRRDQARARVEKLKAMWHEAKAKAEETHIRVESDKSLQISQNQLTNAMRSGAPVEDLQAAVARAKTTAESLRVLRDEAAETARQRWAAMDGPSRYLAQAELDLEEAEFLDLTVRIAKIASQLLPLSARYRELAHQRRIGLNDSGLLPDESPPNIGPYRLLPDGSLAPHYFAHIKTGGTRG